MAFRRRAPRSGAVKCLIEACNISTLDPSGYCSGCRAKGGKLKKCCICGKSAVTSELYYCRQHGDLEKKNRDGLRFQTLEALAFAHTIIGYYSDNYINRTVFTSPNHLRCEMVSVSNSANANLKKDRDESYERLLRAVATFDVEQSMLIDRAVIKGVQNGEKNVQDLLNIVTENELSETGIGANGLEGPTDISDWTDYRETEGGSDLEDDQPLTPETSVPDDLQRSVGVGEVDTVQVPTS